MSSRQPNDRHEYTEGEQQQSFIGRRMDAFASRTREPGDAATWATVLGALLFALLIVCYSVAELPLMALFVLGLMAIWIGVMGRFGHVNVFSILWGSATTDAVILPNEFVVAQSTAVVAAVAVIAMVVDALRGWDFGWYGYALLVAVIGYLVLYIRAWVLPVR